MHFHGQVETNGLPAMWVDKRQSAIFCTTWMSPLMVVVLWQVIWNCKKYHSQVWTEGILQWSGNDVT